MLFWDRMAQENQRRLGLTSLVNKTSGKVKIFGYDLDAEMVRAKQQIGLVPQEFNFNPFETVQQIVVNQAGYYGVSRKKP